MTGPTIDTAKQLAKRLLGRLGLSVSRGPLNRFDVTNEAIVHLRTRGYVPRVVIDAGANVGEWTSMVQAIFPDASFYLIEAQPACRPALDLVCKRLRSASVNPISASLARAAGLGPVLRGLPRGCMDDGIENGICGSRWDWGRSPNW